MFEFTMNQTFVESHKNEEKVKKIQHTKYNFAQGPEKA